MLLRPPPLFTGFDREAFAAFAIPDRESRRRALIDAFHPGLRRLADDLLPILNEGDGPEFHAHLPRLDWPKGYVPFCTWLALSPLPHGYQAGAQLNVGIHHDHVAARLGWDTGADAFGRLEFRCRHGALGAAFRAAAGGDLRYRVYAAASWPEGSRLVFESEDDLDASFREAARRGAWWELGRRWDLPGAYDAIGAPAFSEAVRDVMERLRPLVAACD